MSDDGSQPPRLAYLALAAVCLFWGTTYLGIRIALESFPPLYLIAIRYVISGSVLLAAAAAAGATIPRGRELWQTAVCGIICIGVGNGLLAIAELYVPSGLAALFYTVAPFWMIGIDAFLPGGKRPVLTTIPAGLLEQLPHTVATRSVVAVGYLVVFGSLVGFSAFIYSMAKLPVAVASLYTFVNPVVAMLLGGLLYRESFGSRELVAMIIIFAGIAAVRWSESRRTFAPATGLAATGLAATGLEQPDFPQGKRS